MTRLQVASMNKDLVSSSSISKRDVSRSYPSSNVCQDDIALMVMCDHMHHDGLEVQYPLCHC